MPTRRRTYRAALCWGTACLLLGLRLWTGLVTFDDDPTEWLVAKHAPAWWTEWRDNQAHPAAPYTTLDGDEMMLVYENAYLATVAAAPTLALILAAAGLAFLLPTRRR